MFFSIITINYNNKSGLLKTINSVLSQSCNDYEWIIIDGGSTDGSKELIEQYQQHFAYWCSEPDKGVYNAMNKGLQHIHGQYVSFLNSGDCYADSSVLQAVIDLHPQEDIVYGDWYRSTQDGQVLVHAPKELDLFELYKNNICHQAMFIKCTVHINHQYDEQYTVFADWALWLQCMLEGKTFAYMPLTVCIFDALEVGMSEVFCEKNEQETLALHEQTVPVAIRKTLSDYQYSLTSYQHYRDSALATKTLKYAHEKSLYCKLMVANIRFIELLRKIFK